MIGSKMGKRKRILTIVLSASVLSFMSACASKSVQPLPPLPEVPNYAGLPHPPGFDGADLEAVLRDKRAPFPEKLADCDKNFRKLEKATQSIYELEQGTKELVKADPQVYHWCFYSKLSDLEGAIKTSANVTEKQAILLDAYVFLVPVGHSFKKEYNDSRYLRWAVRHYQKMSEWVFYRKLEMTPQARENLLGGVDNPFSLQRSVIVEEREPVLKKYNIVVDKGPDAIELETRGPASVTPTNQEPGAAQSPAATAKKISAEDIPTADASLDPGGPPAVTQ